MNKKEKLEQKIKLLQQILEKENTKKNKETSTKDYSIEQTRKNRN